MTAYYNEFDPGAAAWLRELIKQGRIAPGEVDERSIEDVHPGDLREFTQCHFFAGIGGWSLALRMAGWPDDRPVWTGSCPCQPFSAAGKGGGFADERHLWPTFHWLIGQCEPPVVFGEQVAGADGLVWLDLVSADLEATGYAFGAADLCAAGVGAPHIRQRLYWVADGGGARLEGRHAGSLGHELPTAERGGGVGGLAYMHGAGRAPGCEGLAPMGHGPAARADRGLVGLADAEQHGGGREAAPAGDRQPEADRSADQHGGHRGASASRPGPLHGFWRDADWLACRDGRWRPVEPGTFPLAHGLPARVGRLRGYGNAIVPQVAEAFIRAFVG